MSETVELRCPGCARTLRVARVETDPCRATTIQVHCLECVGSDFAVVTYFDGDGREVDFDEDERDAARREGGR